MSVCISLQREYHHTRYQMNSWRKTVLEKLIGAQLVKNYTSVYGDRVFITVFTTAD